MRSRLWKLVLALELKAAAHGNRECSLSHVRFARKELMIELARREAVAKQLAGALGALVVGRARIALIGDGCELDVHAADQALAAFNAVAPTSDKQARIDAAVTNLVEEAQKAAQEMREEGWKLSAMALEAALAELKEAQK